VARAGGRRRRDGARRALRAGRKRGARRGLLLARRRAGPRRRRPRERPRPGRTRDNLRRERRGPGLASGRFSARAPVARRVQGGRSRGVRGDGSLALAGHVVAPGPQRSGRREQQDRGHGASRRALAGAARASGRRRGLRRALRHRDDPHRDEPVLLRPRRGRRGPHR
jgi:hypothetical protein